MTENMTAIRAEIAGQAIALRSALAEGPLTRADLARRFVGRGGLSFRQVADLIDCALDGRSGLQRADTPAQSEATINPGTKVAIGSVSLPVAEVQGQRVVTLSMMDQVHQRPDGTAGRNFREHESKLIEGEDFLRVGADEIRRRQIVALSPLARGDIVLLTESGYLMLVKSFTDPLAWQVQRQMVGTYFRARSAVTVSEVSVPTEPGKLIGGVVKSVAGKIVAASEARTLAHIEAIVAAEVRTLETRIMEALARSGRSAEGDAAVPKAPQTVAAMAYVTALDVVHLVIPATPHARRLAQVASSGLRQTAAARGEPMKRGASGRHQFSAATVQAWLTQGGRERLKERGR